MALCEETATEAAALDPRQYETEVEAMVHQAEASLKAEDEEAAKREAAAEELFVRCVSRC